MSFDINADVGEGCGFDAALMPYITSANIAAGFHAGGGETLRETIRLAREHGVAVGAHPGFRDREHFGRREFHIPASEIETLVIEQLTIVAAAAAFEGLTLQHVKPHGALYNMSARDRTVADAIARATARFDGTLILFAPSVSQLYAAGLGAGIRVAGEVFADRAYAPDGSLVPRTQTGAVIHDIKTALQRALQMARDGVVAATDGSLITLRVDTICVHGDTPGCDTLARELRLALECVGGVGSRIFKA